jgi:Trp operon repressor
MSEKNHEKNPLPLNILKVLTKITDEETMARLLFDLATPQELKSLQERLTIVSLLIQGLSYREIAKRVPSSIATVSRVSRFVVKEPHGGYRYLIENIETFTKKDA